MADTSFAVIVVDHGMFDALDDDPTETEFRTEMSIEFLTGKHDFVAKLHALLNAGNIATLKDTAHKEKSGALALGFNAVADRCLKIEQHCRGFLEGKSAADQSYLKAQLQALPEDYRTLQSYLQKFLRCPLPTV